MLETHNFITDITQNRLVKKNIQILMQIHIQSRYIYCGKRVKPTNINNTKTKQVINPRLSLMIYLRYLFGEYFIFSFL